MVEKWSHGYSAYDPTSATFRSGARYSLNHHRFEENQSAAYARRAFNGLESSAYFCKCGRTHGATHTRCSIGRRQLCKWASPPAGEREGNGNGRMV